MSILSDYTYVRAGIMDILLGARGMTEISPEQYAQLVRLCLVTNAWCVREEHNNHLLLAIEKTNGPLTKDIIESLLTVAKQERIDHATELSAFATSLLSNFTKH